MPGLRRVLHAIREHFANPYGAADRYRASAQMAAWSRIGEGKKKPSELDLQSRAFLSLITHLLNKVPSLPLGIVAIGIGSFILLEVWPYQRNVLFLTYVLAVIFAYIAFILVLNGIVLIAEAALHWAKKPEFEMFGLKVFICVCFIAIGFAYLKHAASLGLRNGAAWTLFEIIRSYRQRV